MASVELIAVRKSYGDTEVIHGIDLAIASGEFVVFVGPSGCGKSTLLRMIAGLESITDGEIRIDGVKVNDKPPRSRDIAMVFQDYALYPHKSVRDNMAFGLKLRKFPRAEIERRVRDAAATLKIEPFLDRLPRALSGGQRQRVAMGRAIVRQPKAFLFDEPLSNLDALLRNEVRVEIKKLHQRLRETIVYVTHDQVEAMTLADRIVVLEAGRIGQIGPPDEIYERPRDRFVAGFIGSPPMNFLPAVVERDGDGYALRIGTAQRLRIPAGSAGRYAASAGRSVMLGVRPEHLSIDGRETAGPRLDAEVVVVEPLGAENLVTFKVGAHELRGRFKAGVRPGVGGALSLAVDPERIHLFDAETGRAL